MRKGLFVFIVTSLCCLIAVIGAAPAMAVFGAGQWRAYSVIEPGDTSKGYALAEINGPVYDRALPGLPDLRVIRTAGEEFEEIPYDIVGKTEVPKEQEFVTALINKGTTGKTSTATVDLGNGRTVHNHLRINTGSRDFIKEVTLEGSADRLTWVKVKNSGKIADFSSNGQLFRRTDVTYDPVDFRYLRVTLAGGTGEVVGIDSIDVLYTDPGAGAEKKLALDITGQAVSSRDKTSVITMTSGYDNLPIHKIWLQVEAVNFSRSAVVYGSKDQKDWQQVGAGTLASISLAGYQQSQLELPVDLSGYRFLRVIVRNGDSAPLKVTKAQGLFYPTRVLFPCRSGGEYRLYFGNTAAKQPDYDLAAFSGKVIETGPPVWKLGTPQVNPLFKADAGVTPESEKHKWLLPGMLAVMVAGLAVFIARAVPKVMKGE